MNKEMNERKWGKTSQRVTIVCLIIVLLGLGGAMFRGNKAQERDVEQEAKELQEVPAALDSAFDEAGDELQVLKDELKAVKN